MFMSSIDEFKSLYSDFEHLLNRISIPMDDELPDDAPSVPPSIPAVISHSRSITHLKLALTMFSGHIIDWEKFWNAYEGRIERETALSDLEKIGCLEDAMQSDEAKDIV